MEDWDRIQRRMSMLHVATSRHLPELSWRGLWIGGANTVRELRRSPFFRRLAEDPVASDIERLRPLRALAGFNVRRCEQRFRFFAAMFITVPVGAALAFRQLLPETFDFILNWRSFDKSIVIILGVYALIIFYSFLCVLRARAVRDGLELLQATRFAPVGPAVDGTGAHHDDEPPFTQAY